MKHADHPTDAATHPLHDELREQFADTSFRFQQTRDRVPTFWVFRDQIPRVLEYLKSGVPRPYRMLYDLTAVDERERQHRPEQAEGDFTVVYVLFSFDRNAYCRFKTGILDGQSVPSITRLWSNATWYEREVWDMFGIRFDNHRGLRRILMPPTWEGHPLRKEHPARATEMGPYELTDEDMEREQEALQFRPEEWGLERQGEDSDFMFLNVGPQHPGTHGVLRVILQMDGEEIVDAIPDIGFHHRGAEKMGERQTWHTYIPYTDRIDYLAGVQNNLAYLLTVEQLAGIEVPDRAKVIRIMLCEIFRIASHLVWYGTFAQDVGQLSAVFYMFTDRERAFDIVEAVCGDRMHPNWFRIGGVAQDLPEGWERLVNDFLEYFPKRLREYEGIVMKNRIFKARTVGVGAYTRDQAIEWGVTGPGLRASGLEWDFRKKQPYGGYDAFDFEVPTGTAGDCYARAQVRVEEMRQSLRIIEQCVKHMPPGPYRSRQPGATPPLKERTMHDIETLINHFLSVSWGPVVPAGEGFVSIEAPKGNNGYYLISDGGIHPYRVRIRTPSFAHMQMLPELTRGALVPDLLAVLGSIDFVLADVDR